uniref:Uncharacterized protein n=1 Tax=Chenopodium quinoa TaxID=63459 RepID=A0A803LNT7_CHEQI
MEDEEDLVYLASDLSDSSEDFQVEDDDDDDELNEVFEVADEEDDKPVNYVAIKDNDLKSQNVAALIRGNLVAERQSSLPRVLSARKPFKPPFANGWSKSNEDLLRRLSARKRFVPWGANSSDVVPLVKFQPIVVEEDDEQEEVVNLPPGIEPLVLWQPEESMDGGSVLSPISVDSLLVRFLRPHQRYNSSSDVMKLLEKVYSSCSDVSLGYKLLPISSDAFWLMIWGNTLFYCPRLWEIIKDGFDGKPMVKKAIIVTPTSLVNNWEAEIKKWVQDRVHLIALCESSREDCLSAIENFTNSRSKTQVLIVSYETFRMHAPKFSHSGSCDLLICDEAHRLKNGQTITNKALASLVCKRRILLSGTPMQNDLEELYAMVNFTNPGILGDDAHFRRYYQAPILNGREPTASDEEKKVGHSRSEELSAIVNQLIYDTIKAGNSGIAGFEDCLSFFPPEVFSGRSGVWSGGDGLWIELSGKMHVLARLLAQLRQKTDDRIVLVSNYTQDEFAFLLSSKAGGCGLNLIGGNRLVLFDPDWNPANDKQAAARVWRDGQKKRVSEIHEKMDCVRCRISDTTDTIQNGMLKNRVEVDCIESNSEGYQSGQNADDIGGFAEISGLHMLKSSQKQVGSPSEEDLLNWAHHSSPTSVPDVLFQAAAGDEVTFAFTNQIDGKLVPEESMRPPKVQGIEESRTSVNLKWSNSEGTLKHKFSKLSEQQSSLSHGRNPVKKLPLVSTKPIQVAPLKSIKSSLKDVTNLSWRSNCLSRLSAGSYL